MSMLATLPAPVPTTLSSLHSGTALRLHAIPFIMFPESPYPSQMAQPSQPSLMSNVSSASISSMASAAADPDPSPAPSTQPPTSTLDQYKNWLSNTPQPLPLASHASRQSTQEFEPVSPNPDGLSPNINYTLLQLKSLASDNGLKRSGTKAVVRQRLHAALVHTWHAIRVQAVYRGHLVRRYLAAKGLDGPKRPANPANDAELETFDPIDTVPVDQLFSIPGTNDRPMLYSIDALQRTIRTQMERDMVPSDPYTNLPFDAGVLARMQEEAGLARLLGRRVDVVHRAMGAMTRHLHMFRTSVVDVCTHLDTLGHTTNPEWFLDLSSSQWRRLCAELADIWSYRAGLDNGTRQRIGGVWPIAIPSSAWSHSEIRIRAIEQLGRLVYRGIDRDAQALGAYYVLIALTLVSMEAAEGMPWLYEAGRLA
jgi:hypothetical protein